MKFRVDERVESDHAPISIELKEEKKKRTREKEKNEGGRSNLKQINIMD